VVPKLVTLNGDRYAHIDAMRGIAALCVAVLHISQTLDSAAGGGQWLLKFATDWQLGAFGVSLFFLVSGFVIPASFGNREGRAGELRIFVIRRFFRLYPVYWLSIPLALWSTWWLYGRPIDAGTVVANITMFQRVLGFEDIQGLYWTLAYELAFYVACAALYAAGVLHRPGALVAVLYGFVVLFAAVALFDLRRDFYFRFFADLPVYLGMMFAGALLRQWHDGEPIGRGLKVALVIILLMFVLPAARSLRFEDGQLLLRSTGDWGRALAVVFFVLFAMRFRLSHPVLSWLGAISYALYLFHPVWMYFAQWLLRQPGFEWTRGWDLVTYCLLVLAVTIGFSALVHRWLELPMIALGRRLSRRAASSGGTAPPPLHA
jgi:peptidoglycan/LPS O-acetylase OafA/YrhL